LQSLRLGPRSPKSRHNDPHLILLDGGCLSKNARKRGKAGRRRGSARTPNTEDAPETAKNRESGRAGSRLRVTWVAAGGSRAQGGVRSFFGQTGGEGGSRKYSAVGARRRGNGGVVGE